LIKTNKTIRQTNLIGLLNPVLRGWANYHSHVVAKKVFNQEDSAVWEMLWRWAVRRQLSQDTPMGEGSVFQSTRGASMGILMC
jgi:RNA-directed DNA polymerase